MLGFSSSVFLWGSGGGNIAFAGGLDDEEIPPKKIFYNKIIVNKVILHYNRINHI